MPYNGFTDNLQNFREDIKKKTGTILIVDDEPSYLKMISHMLEKNGYETVQAGSTQEALLILKSYVIEVCLLDIQMPNQSGDKFLNTVKHSYPDVAFIMSTGNNDLDMAAKCHDMGADDYLLKPFNVERLLISLHNVLERRHLARENKYYRTQMEKKLEEQAEQLRSSHSMLIQQEKLAAIGQLAAGVAHEINNPLGFIYSNLSTLQIYTERISDYLDKVNLQSAHLPPEQLKELQLLQKNSKINTVLDDLPELLAETIDGAERIKKIIQSLKSFSRNDPDQSLPVCVNECLEKAITMVWNEIKYIAQIEKDLQTLPTIQGYPQQLSQVFMNLLINAVHAMSSNGLIRVTTTATDDAIRVTVSDNGSGIAPQHLHKIFDPFFTTKAPGKGTGLGMCIIKDIINKHEGSIDVSSTLGQGTTFTIHLPLKTAVV